MSGVSDAPRSSEFVRWLVNLTHRSGLNDMKMGFAVVASGDADRLR